MKGNSRTQKLLATLQEGIGFHNRGLLDQADVLYQHVLSQEPRHPDALHLRALVALARGQSAEAAKLAESAIRVAPKVANFRNTAGEAWRRAGQLEKARTQLEDAVSLDPRMVMAQHNLSLVLLAQGQAAAARQANQRALDLDPANVDALAGGVEIASALGDDALATDMLQRLGRVANPAVVKQASASFHIARARRLLKEDKAEAADQAAAAAIEAKPEFWGGWLVRTDAMAALGQWAQALSCAQTAARLAPDNEDVCLNLAILLNRQKRHGDAEALLSTWLQKHPDHPNATFTLATAQLAQGKYADGWRGYEARWQSSWQPSPRAPFPMWAGQAVASLLIHAEQGLGDSVMMMRFLPEVQRRCTGLLTLQVPAPLYALAERVLAGRGIRVVLDPGGLVFEAACPLMSLPFVLGVSTPAALLGDTAYLHPESQRVAAFRERLAAYPGRKLGLVWQGSATSRINRFRGIAENELLPLLGRPGWTAVSLQHGCKSPRIAGMPLVDCAESIKDFEDLAALMAAVDGVVSLDSGPAHLAGALGIPAHTLVPWIHDWRWGVESKTSPWYANMRLHRQESDGRWAPAIAALAAELDALPTKR